MVRACSLSVVMAVVVAACGGGGGEGSSSTSSAARGPLVVDGEVDIEVLQAQVDEFLALEAVDQEARLASVDGAFERELWTLSGLEAALGGPEAADAAFASHSAAIVSSARGIAEQPIVLVGLRTAEATPSLGMGLFGGMLLVTAGAEPIVSASNDLKDGQTDSTQVREGMKVSGSLDHVEMDVESPPFVEDGVTTKLRVKVSVDPCPDPTGKFTGKAKVDVSASATGGSAGQNGTLDVTVSGQVDDAAELVSTDADYEMQWSKFGGGAKGSYVDVAGSIGDTKVVSATLKRSGGAPNVEMQEGASWIGMMYALMAKDRIATAAEKGWKSGRCVTLKPTAAPGPSGLEPGATSTINAAPRSRIDGSAAGGSVTATLSAGGASVDPSESKVPADATFTYTAPDEKDKTGTVSLEARSRRGIAKATIDFDTKAAGAYHFVGGLQDFQVAQDVCDISQPFTLNSPGVGSADFSGGLTGTYAANGVFGFHYEGTYVITLPNGPGKPGSMAATSSGQIAGQGGSGTEKYQLTPLDSCG